MSTSLSSSRGTLIASAQGSYIINPDLPGSSTAHTRMLDRRDKKRLRHNIVPNATFKTHHGAVNVNLATAGNNDQSGKAYVQIVTRHGKVNVNLVGSCSRVFVTCLAHVLPSSPCNLTRTSASSLRRATVCSLPNPAPAAMLTAAM